MKFASLKNNEKLSKKLIQIAQHESELDLGVNPRDFEQANTSYLTKHDFEYIKKVCSLVETRLQDSNWITKTLVDIESKTIIRKTSVRGIRFDDELYKAGRGILESVLKDNQIS